jgi:hypothetical protein
MNIASMGDKRISLLNIRSIPEVGLLSDENRLRLCTAILVFFYGANPVKR